MAGDRILVILVRTIGLFFRTIPFSWGIRIAEAAGTFLFWMDPKRKYIAFANMTQALGESLGVEERLLCLKRLYQNLAISFVEILRFPELTSAEIHERVEFNGAEQMKPFVQTGNKKGFIALTAHFGNWELMSQAFALVGVPANIVVRNQKLSELNQLLNGTRELHGCRVITKGMALRGIFQALKREEAVAMVSDQDGGKNGIFSPLFGRLASTKPGAFSIAMKMGKPLIPVFIVRDSQKRDRHTIYIEEPLAVPQSENQIPQAAAAYLKLVEKYVRRAPDQWLWLHHRWKSSPIQKIVVLEDGKKGHLKQSLAVAGLMAETREQTEKIEIQTVEIRFKSRFKKMVVSLLLTAPSNSLVWRWRIFKWGLTENSFQSVSSTRGDIVISAGASLSAVNGWLGKSWYAKNIHLMKPNLVPWRRFNKIILPRHDWNKKESPPKNVILTKITPSFFNDEGSLEIPSPLMRQSLPDSWQAGASGGGEGQGEGERAFNKIGILLGGDNDEYRMDSGWVAQLFNEILKGTDRKLLVTTSRRTSAETEAIVEKRLKDHPQCDLLEIANRSKQNGIVEKILQDAGLILVTGESMSMVSEAVSSGKPVVVVFPPAKRRNVTKHFRMVKKLEKQGFVKRVELNQVAESLAVPVIESEITQKLLNEERERLLAGLRGL